MIKYIVVIVSIYAIVIALLIFLKHHHAPNSKLISEMEGEILKYGLIHFTRIENETKILDIGLFPGDQKPENKTKVMYKGEENLVWLFSGKIYNPQNPDSIVNSAEYQSKFIQSKGYDCAILVEVNKSELQKIRCRKQKIISYVHEGAISSEKLRTVWKRHYN